MRALSDANHYRYNPSKQVYFVTQRNNKKYSFSCNNLLSIGRHMSSQ